MNNEKIKQNIERVYSYIFHTLGCGLKDAEKILTEVLKKRRKRKMEKQTKQRRMQVIGKDYEPMPIETFRVEWLAKGYELVDITKLCNFKLGDSGLCNDFNSPEENIYHIQVWYRNEWIGSFYPSIEQPSWDEKYVVFVSDEDFIIFKKCKLEVEGQRENRPL